MKDRWRSVILAPFLATATLPLGSALAADWVRVSAPDQHMHFYDRSKLAIDGDEITYWRRVLFRVPQSTPAGMARMAMYRERIDCQNHTQRTLGYLLYAPGGGVLENVYSPDAAAEPIIPETLGDRFETLMCVFVDEAKQAHAKEAAQTDDPAVTAALRAEIARLEARVEELEAQLRETAPSPTTPAPTPATH